MLLPNAAVGTKFREVKSGGEKTAYTLGLRITKWISKTSEKLCSVQVDRGKRRDYIINLPAPTE